MSRLDRYGGQLLQCSCGTTRSRRKSCALCEPELDRNIWQHLPAALVHIVLQYLPDESIFKFRSVCKKWFEILTSPRFLEARLGTPHRSPFCVLVDFPNKLLSVYNIASDDWCYHPYDSFFTKHFSSERTILSASAAGLVLLTVLSETRRFADGIDDFEFGGGKIESLLVMNPVNKSYRRLPALEEGNRDNDESGKFSLVLGMDLDSQRGSFQILSWSTVRRLLDDRFQVRADWSQFHVYEQESNTWETIFDSRLAPWPEEPNKRHEILKPAVLHGGFWYYVTFAYPTRARERSTVHVFRIQRGVAEAVQAPLPHEARIVIDFLQLFVSQGKLILAGSLKKMDVWMGFRLWELDEDRSEWVHYLTMPLYLVNYEEDTSGKLSEQFAVDLECSADGDYICFWVGRPAGNMCRTIEIVMYSISTDSWSTVDVPDTPRAPRESRVTKACLFDRKLQSKPFAYFFFKPNLNITL